MSHAVKPRLRVSGLRIRRKGRVVLDRLDLTHEPGSLVWVTGENGAGKSSLLRVFARRLTPETGSVDLLPAGSPVAYYHPGMGLPRDARVADWRRLLGLPADAHGDLAPPVGAHDSMDRLSTGEGKRLLLAGLLSRNAPFTFLDEPYEHLSPQAKATLTGILLLRARSGVVVVATNQEVPTTGSPVVVQVDRPATEVDTAGSGR